MTTRTERPGIRFAAPTSPRGGAAGGARAGPRRGAAAGRRRRGRAPRRSATSPTARPGDLVVVNNSATVAGRAGRPAAAASRSAVHAASRLDDGTWVVELRTAPDAAARSSTRGPARPIGVAGLPLTLLAPYPTPGSVPDRLRQPAVARRRRGRPARAAWPARPADHATATCDRRWPLSAYQTIFAAHPAAPRCPAPAGRSPTVVTAPGRARDRCRADHAAHRCLVAGGRRATAARAVRRAGDDRPTGRGDPGRRAGGSSPSGTTVTRALESSPTTGACGPRRAGPTSSSARPRGPAWWTG